MKFIIIQIFFSLLLTFFCFCKKDNKNIILGNVSELITNKALEGVEIILKVNKISSGSVSTSFKTLSTTYSDNSGDFKFEFGPKKAISYRMVFVKAGFISRTIDINAKDYVATYNISEKLAYLSNIKIKIRNIYPFNNNDKLQLRINMTYDNICNNCCHSDIREFIGVDVNDIIMCQAIGNDSVKIMTIVEKNQNVNVTEIKLFCPPNDTLKYIIDY